MSATPKVTVVDALMGSGKTYHAIEMMRSMCVDVARERRDHPAKRFVFITPFLDEVERIKNDLPDYAWLIKDPKRFEMRAADAEGITQEGVGKRKLDDLNDKLTQGQCIVSTHSLFGLADERTTKAMSGHRYVLLVDEVADWVTRCDIPSDDIKILFDAGVLHHDPSTGRVSWIDKPPRVLDDGTVKRRYQGEAFKDLRRMCLAGKVVGGRERDVSEKTGKEGTKPSKIPTLLLWKFPIEFLYNFEEVWIFTHLFEGSDMAAYLAMHGVNVVKKGISLDRTTLIDFDQDVENAKVARIKSMVTVVGTKQQAKAWPEVNFLQHKTLNDVGNKRGRQQPLSHGWFKNAKKNGTPALITLKNNVKNLFTNVVPMHLCRPVLSEHVMWGTYEVARPCLTGNGHGRGFVMWNARATNNHRGRHVLAYCVNLHHNPEIKWFFYDAGVDVDEDFFALMTMLQWIWRSAIRDDGRPIIVYVPSERMRGLLLNWLHGKLPAGNRLREKAPSSPAPVLTADQAAVGEGLPEARKKTATEEWEEAVLA